jgi:hypothetical protein
MSARKAAFVGFCLAPAALMCYIEWDHTRTMLRQVGTDSRAAREEREEAARAAQEKNAASNMRVKRAAVFPASWTK